MQKRFLVLVAAALLFSFDFAGAQIFPAHHLAKRARPGEIARDGVRDLAFDEMNLAGPIVAGSDMQYRCRQIETLQRNEIAHVEIAESPARIARSGIGPRPQKRLHCCPEFGQFEWLLDELNCAGPRTLGIQFRRNTRRNREQTRVRIGGRDPFQKLDRIGSRRIEVDDQQLRAALDDVRLGLGQRFDRAHAMARREFFQGRDNSGRKRIVFFDEKNARRCPGWRFLGSRHGGSERKGRG